VEAAPNKQTVDIAMQQVNARLEPILDLALDYVSLDGILEMILVQTAPNKLLVMDASKLLLAPGAPTLKLANLPPTSLDLVSSATPATAEPISTAKDVWEIANAVGVQKETLAKTPKAPLASNPSTCVPTVTTPKTAKLVTDNGDVIGVFKTKLDLAKKALCARTDNKWDNVPPYVTPSATAPSAHAQVDVDGVKRLLNAMEQIQLTLLVC